MVKKSKTEKKQMRKLLKSNKPTEAVYFKSESQRKRTGRLSFIYGSPKVVAILTVLVLGSALTGTYIVQKSRGSEAAVQRVGVSFNKADGPVAYGKWYPGISNGVFEHANFSTADGQLTLGFKAGGPGRFEYGNGFRICYNINLGSSGTHPGLLYHNVRFTYRTNEAGTNGVGVYLNSSQVGLTEDTKLNGTPGTPHQGGALFDKTIVANLGSAPPGSVVSFCNVKIGGSTAYFNTDKYVQVYAYTFGGSYEEEQDVEILGTVADSAGKGIAGVRISNCITNPAATSDVNGQYRFYVRKGTPYCVRTQEGLSTSIYSGVKATNTNHPPLSADGASYENQSTTVRKTNYDFKATLKPASTPTNPSSPATTKCTNNGNSNPVEAENAYCQGSYIVADDGAASKSKTVLLKNDKDSVEYTFTAPQDGRYNAVIRMRAQPGASGNANLEFKKLNPGAASETKNDNNKGISASSSYTSYTLKDSSGAVEQTMAKNQQAIIKVQQVGSPDIVVDQLQLLYVGPLATTPNPTPNPSTQTFERCSNTGSGQVDYVEAEQALCSANVIVAADGAASQGKAALLDKDKQYVEYVFTAPKEGKYNAVAKARSQTSASKAYFEFKKLVPGSSSDTKNESNKSIATGSSYSNYTLKDSAGTVTHNMSPGQQAIIRVQQQGSAKVVVDQLIMNYVRPLDTNTDGSQNNPGSSNASACTNTGSGQPLLVEAENALCTNSVKVINDAAGKASGGKAALMEKKGQTVEYVFTATEAGYYNAVVAMRSQASPAGKVYIQFKKLNDGGASDTQADRDKVVGTSSTYSNYSPKKSNGKPLEYFFTAGQQAIIRVGLEADAKVAVDEIKMPYYGPNSNEGVVAPPQSNVPNTSPSTTLPSPTSCISGTSVEAEDGIRKGTTGVANDPLYPEVRSTVLQSVGSYVECTLKAPKSGTFALGAIIRSEDYNGVAEAKLSMAGYGTVYSRTVKAQPDQIYSLVRQNEKPYAPLSAGQPIVVRVTYTNTNNSNEYGGPGKDRNLWVDKMMLVEIPETDIPNPSGGSSPQDPNNPSVVVPCDELDSVEAERMSVFNGAKVEGDSTASQKSMVRISGKNQYVQCKLRVQEGGDYLIRAKAKGQNRLGKTEIKLCMGTVNKNCQQEDTIALGTTYDAVRMRGDQDKKRNMGAGGSVIVTVSSPNANTNIATRKNLILDYVELIKIPGTSANTPSVPANPVGIDRGNEPTTIPYRAQTGVANLSYDTTSGVLYMLAEAESAGFVGDAFDEQPAQGASGNKAVRLWSNKNFVEYTFNVPETDLYGLDFAGRSENYKNITAEAQLSLNGKAIKPNSKVKLISTATHRYYVSPQKVELKKGPNTFRVQFTNDDRGVDGDRNLIIDFLRLRGSKRLIPVQAPVSTPQAPILEPLDPNTQYMEAEDATKCRAQEVSFDCGKLAVSDAKAYGKRALILNNTLDFVEGEFTAPATGKYSIGATMRSMDYQGSAKAHIYVDGVKVAENISPSASSYTPVYAFEKNFNYNTPHRIRVQFTNDQCGSGSEPCNATNDRNLLVDQLRLTLISITQQPPASSNSTTSPTPTPSAPGTTINGEVPGGLITNLFTKAGWRHKVPVNEPNHPQSSAIASAFVKLSKNAGTENSPLMFVGKTSDPVQTIAGKQFYWPSNATPSSGPDATVEVLNPVTPDGLSNRIARKYEDKIYGGTYTGVADALGDGYPYAGNGTAWGLMSSSAVVTPQELAAGVIPHAIGVAIGNNVLSPNQYMAPARRSEGKASGSTIPMGARFQITTPMDQINAELERQFSGEDLRVAKIIWTAIHDYGFIARDGTGSNGCWIYIGGGNKSSLPSGQAWSQVFRKPAGLWSANNWRTPARSQY